METRHLSTSWTYAGYGSSLAAFVVSAFFFLDVFGEYFVNTSYLFPLALWVETTVAIVAAVTGVILGYLTYRSR